MPEKLADDLADQQLADLLAYLSTLRQPVVEAGEYYLVGPVPAGAVDPTASPRPGGSSGWRRVQASRDGLLDLSATLGAKEGSEVLVYLPLTSPTAQNVEVVLNSASSLALWHNGKSVAIQKSPVADVWQAKVDVSQGVNPIVVKVASGKVNAGLTTTFIAERQVRFSFDAAAAAK
jgi:hypothetical protein